MTTVNGFLPLSKKVPELTRRDTLTSGTGLLNGNKKTTEVPRGKKVVTIKLPGLYTGLLAQPARLNPFLKSDISRQAEEWSREIMGLNEKGYARLRGAQFPLLAAGFAPDTDANGFRILCDWMIWVFYFDDLFDDGELRNDPMAARREINAHLALHSDDHPDVSPKERPVRLLYQTLWRKIKAISTKGAQQRYIQSMRHYFEGIALQVDSVYWHSQGYTATTFDMYWRGRTHSAGSRPCQALLEPLYKITLPDHVWDHPMIKEAEDTATHLIMFYNDVLSYRKEASELVPHNSIHILQRERGYSLQEAYDFANQLIKQMFQRWYWAQQCLPSWGEEIDIQVQKYLQGVLDQAKGNLDWSFGSRRYLGKDSEAARATMTLDFVVDE
ncbi:terpenoid synthase [Aaosphaeria arxii CBS 175.79]|uniref:Terpene synthase n=1 Tax=Aaosphaeria arxii CBS 175.79 TaxID=1450172 RepID=A0A6A5XHW0_9PLEO|nr:terpenoid synthase [Aaosphaeria arxii CBS 175.79]KAF2012828.1 terpenoid synthase [Aaosphaeria arxii CBS 175.79]